MEWLIIPGIIAGLAIALYVLAAWLGADDGLIAIAIVGGIVVVLSLSLCPTFYYGSRNAALRAEAYYEHIVLPHVVAQEESYVVVHNIETAIWQAGEQNLTSYNAYLRSTRYWDSIPVINTAVYKPPEHLKYVRIAKE